MTSSSQKSTMFLFLVSILCQWTQTSYNIVKTLQDDIEKENLCSTKPLSVFLNDIDPNQELTAFEGSPTVRGICPFLKYSCCNDTQLSDLTQKLTYSLSYINFRFQKFYELFFTLNEVQESEFSDFLKTLKPDDIKCYNDNQEAYYSDLVSKAKAHKDEEADEWLKKTKDSFYYNETLLIKKFKDLKGRLLDVMERIRGIKLSRANFTGNLICNMCSPIFSKYFITKGKEVPEMEVRFDLCKSMLKEKMDYLNVLGTLEDVQSILNLSFCNRTNSNPDKNYDLPSHEDLLVWNINPQSLRKVTSDTKNCVQTIGAYDPTHPLYKQCSSSCVSSFFFLLDKAMSIDRLINSKIEIWNMFKNKGSSADTKTLLDKNLQNYWNERGKFEAMGIVKVTKKGNTFAETIEILPKLHPEYVDLTNLDIKVNQNSGLAITVMTLMNKDFLHTFANIIQTGILLSFISLLK
jgi:hypothetical protein